MRMSRCFRKKNCHRKEAIEKKIAKKIKKEAMRKKQEEAVRKKQMENFEKRREKLKTA